MTTGGTDAALLQRIEAYFDAVPRPAACVEQHGPLTLFISRIPWRFYGRPRMGLAPRDAIGADDVRALRARQRALGVREALEWVAETTPSLAGAARATGMEVVAVPLLAAAAADVAGAPAVEGVTLRMLGPDDPALVPSQDVVEVAFGGQPGATEAGLGFLRDRIRNGITGVGVAEAGGRVVAAGSHQPVGSVSEIMGVGTAAGHRGRGIGSALTARLADDARASGATLLVLSAADERVARLYERLGFRRVGTACFGRAA
ncbi:MAG: GNAT family N-acetyltransferase [Solirubrobacteraceae bacterium]